MSEEESVPATLDLDKIRERFRLQTPDRDFVDDHAMPVVQGLVEVLTRLAGATKDLMESHHALMSDTVDPDADAVEVRYVVQGILSQLELREPTDWNYVRRFSATPNEIHSILAHGLSENVHLAYQRFIGKAVAAEAAGDIRNDPYDLHTAEDAAGRIDPIMGGGPYPSKLVTPEG